MKTTKSELSIKVRTYERRPELSLEARVDMVNDINKLRRINFKLDRINTDDCNGNPIQKTEIRDGKRYTYNIQDVERAEKNEKMRIRLIAKASVIALKWDFEIDFNGDPRGSAIKLNINPGTSDISYGADTDILCRE